MPQNKKMKNKKESSQGMTKEDLRKFEDQWVENMSTYWVEKLVQLRAVKSGALARSFRGASSDMSAGGRMLEHKFLLYGFYVAIGVGPHGKRKPKEWYFKAYRRSIEKLERIESEALGDEYVGLVKDHLGLLFDEK